MDLHTGSGEVLTSYPTCSVDAGSLHLLHLVEPPKSCLAFKDLFNSLPPVLGSLS